VIIGGGRNGVLKAAAVGGLDAAEALKAKGYEVHDALDSVPATARRVVVLPADELEIAIAVTRALDVLSRNPNGFFLMVESDLHTEQLVRGLDRAVQLDRAIKDTVARMGGDALVIFTADHSYDLRVHDGDRGAPLLPGLDAAYGDDEDSVRLDNVRRDNDHTGEEVIVAAAGPGAERVRGVLSNVDLFDIMRSAYGWPASASLAQPRR